MSGVGGMAGRTFAVVIVVSPNTALEQNLKSK